MAEFTRQGERPTTTDNVTVVDTTHTKGIIPIFSNLNKLYSFSFSVT
jgi:hypothetical protein